MSDDTGGDMADFVLVDLGMMLNREGKTLSDLFSVMDEDGDKSITPDEFRRGLLTLGIAELDENEIDRLVKAVDLDGDGMIDLLELHNAFNEHNMPTRIIGADASESPSGPGPQAEGFRPWNEKGASKMALLFPDVEALQDPMNARAISGFSMFGLLLFWWNGIFGVARQAMDMPRDHAIDLMAMMTGGDHNSAPAPHLDALSTLLMILLVYMMFLASPSFIVAMFVGGLIFIAAVASGGAMSWMMMIISVGLIVWGALELNKFMPFIPEGMLAVGGGAAAVASTTTEDDTPKEKSRDSDITEIAEEE
jgi:hypothetical protein